MANLHANTFSAVTVPTTTETVVGVISPFNVNSPGGEGIFVDGTLNITTGTATTAITVRVRQGTAITGSLVGSADTHTIGAAVSANVAFSKLDASTVLGTGVQYCVTVQQTAATANGTVNSGVITVQDAASFE